MDISEGANMTVENETFSTPTIFLEIVIILIFFLGNVLGAYRALDRATHCLSCNILLNMSLLSIVCTAMWILSGFESKFQSQLPLVALPCSSRHVVASTITHYAVVQLSMYFRYSDGRRNFRHPYRWGIMTMVLIVVMLRISSAYFGVSNGSPDNMMFQLTCPVNLGLEWARVTIEYLVLTLPVTALLLTSLVGFMAAGKSSPLAGNFAEDVTLEIEDPAKETDGIEECSSCKEVELGVVQLLGVSAVWMVLIKPLSQLSAIAFDFLDSDYYVDAGSQLVLFAIVVFFCFVGYSPRRVVRFCCP